MLALSLTMAVLLTQRADGGVSPAVRRPDAGVALPVVADAQKEQKLELEKLRREVNEAKVKLSELEARLGKAEAALTKADATASKVDALAKKLEALDARLDEAEAQREAVEQRAAQKRAGLEQAAVALNGALQSLSLGSTNVEQQLRVAEAAYEGAALQNLRLARQALANGDLNAARQAITLAILEAQAQR